MAMNVQIPFGTSPGDSSEFENTVEVDSDRRRPLRKFRIDGYGDGDVNRTGPDRFRERQQQRQDCQPTPDSIQVRSSPTPRSRPGSTRVYVVRACGAASFTHTIYCAMQVVRSAIMRVIGSLLRVAVGIVAQEDIPGDFELAFKGVTDGSSTKGQGSDHHWRGWWHWSRSG